ncbi:MAG: preprotein translocase subunit YajC [Terriglobia bacterium]
MTAFLPLLFILVIFYFLLIRPAQRQRKHQQQMLAALRTGDRVITNGGILGTIVGIKENVIVLRIADQVRIEVLRSAIAGLQPTASDSAAKS